MELQLARRLTESDCTSCLITGECVCLVNKRKKPKPVPDVTEADLFGTAATQFFLPVAPPSILAQMPKGFTMSLRTCGTAHCDCGCGRIGCGDPRCSQTRTSPLGPNGFRSPNDSSCCQAEPLEPSPNLSPTAEPPDMELPPLPQFSQSEPEYFQSPLPPLPILPVVTAALAATTPTASASTSCCSSVRPTDASSHVSQTPPPLPPAPQSPRASSRANSGRGQARVKETERDVKNRKHNESELRRRKRLNECFVELASVCRVDGSKARVLASAIDVVTNLEERKERLDRELKELQERVKQAQAAKASSGLAPAPAFATTKPASRVPMSHDFVLHRGDAPQAILSLSGVFWDCNDQFGRTLRFGSREELLRSKSTLFSLASPDTLQRIFHSIAQLMGKGPRLQKVAVDFRCVDGARHAGRLMAWLVRDDHDQPAALHVVLY